MNVLKQRIIICVAAVILAVITAIAVIGSTVSNVAFATDVPEEIYYGDDLYGDSVDNSESEVEYINYATKNETIGYINNTYPDFYNLNNTLKNGCANVAGASIIGYYDRFYEDFIPDSTPGFVRNNIYNYYSMGMYQEQKQAVINTLYVDMKTNNPNAGTSQANYKLGLSAFISRKGKSASFTSVMTNGKFDLNKAIAQFNQGYPISLYLQGYNVCTIENLTNNQTRLIKVIHNANHIMIAYGYRKVDYYNENNSIVKSNIYLLISTGLMGSSGVYIVNNNGILDDAESVSVY